MWCKAEFSASLLKKQVLKNFIWTTLKVIFSIFRFFLHPQIPDLQILSYNNKPYINGMLFIQLSDDV